MFLGQWNHSHAVGCLPIGGRSKQKKLKVWVVRERFGDCAVVSVEVRLFQSRANKRPFLVHEVTLGNLNDAPFKARLKVDEGDFNDHLIQNPPIVRELRVIVKAIEKYAAEQAKKNAPVDTRELGRICEAICLYPAEKAKAA